MLVWKAEVTNGGILNSSESLKSSWDAMALELGTLLGIQWNSYCAFPDENIEQISNWVIRFYSYSKYG